MVEPRLSYLPKCKPSKRVLAEEDRIWKETQEVLALANLDLDEEQELVLRASLRLRALDRWLAMEVGVTMPRQNGKGVIIEARQLAGVYVLEERLQIYSSHHFKTSLEAMQRLEYRILDTPLEKGIKRNKFGALMIKHMHGEEGITFTGNRRVNFQTRTKGSGRGLTCNTLYGDEAMFFAEFQHGALMPTLSAVPNPQVWYAGSAVDQEIHEHGIVFARVRQRAIKGDDDALAYFEWSVGNGRPENDHPSKLPEETFIDQAAWAQANFALGRRIRPEVIAAEQRSMTPRTFAVERLGAGDWPDPDATYQSSPISIEEWLELIDANGQLEEPVVFAFDVSPERRASIAVAGSNLEGLFQVEITDARSGTSWLPKRLRELRDEWSPAAIVCDGYGPSSSLVGAIEDLGLRVEQLSTSEHGQACGRLVDLVQERGLRHLGSAEIVAALRGAKTRPLGDAWAWSRRSSEVDISPLVAATLAISAAVEQRGRSVYDERGVLAL